MFLSIDDVAPDLLALVQKQSYALSTKDYEGLKFRFLLRKFAYDDSTDSSTFQSLENMLTLERYGTIWGILVIKKLNKIFADNISNIFHEVKKQQATYCSKYGIGSG